MVIDNKGKLPLHLVGQSASQKNRGKSEDIIKLLKSKMPDDDDEGKAIWPALFDVLTVVLTNRCPKLKNLIKISTER